MTAAEAVQAGQSRATQLQRLAVQSVRSSAAGAPETGRKLPIAGRERRSGDGGRTAAVRTGIADSRRITRVSRIALGDDCISVHNNTVISAPLRHSARGRRCGLGARGAVYDRHAPQSSPTTRRVVAAAAAAAASDNWSQPSRIGLRIVLS